MTHPLFSDFDREIAGNHPEVDFLAINWIRKYSIKRFTLTLLTKLLRVAARAHIHICTGQQIFSGYLLLTFHTKKIVADIYHSHTPGALGAAVNAAQKHRARCSFDAEDYHIGEDQADNAILRLENIFIPKLDLVTTSSPLITKLYAERYPSIRKLTVLNAMTAHRSSEGRLPNNSLRAVWFSQKVGLDRGIQDIIAAINTIKSKPVTFDIIGECDSDVRKQLLSHSDGKSIHSVNFIGPLPPEKLQEKLLEFDIGIASEPGKDLNNELALSNKLFTYISCGLAVLVSDTKAQSIFMKENKRIGFLYERRNRKQIRNLLETWIGEPHILMQHKAASKRLSERLNAATETARLLSEMTNLLRDE